GKPRPWASCTCRPPLPPQELSSVQRSRSTKYRSTFSFFLPHHPMRFWASNGLLLNVAPKLFEPANHLLSEFLAYLLGQKIVQLRGIRLASHWLHLLIPSVVVIRVLG